ncbi:MAG: hypothetical protein CVU99_16040 [Firmicutes bacterium HGW-Firmicutes-4]|jgi:hypothetical protein|nr:MAG: hypothetical protein CVU99_16040 [Firmicutes bacterium HGW-Firmicutes-4]
MFLWIGSIKERHAFNLDDDIGCRGFKFFKHLQKQMHRLNRRAVNLLVFASIRPLFFIAIVAINFFSSNGRSLMSLNAFK